LVESLHQKVIEGQRESNRKSRGRGYHRGILVSALVGPEQGRLRLSLPGNQSTDVPAQKGIEWMEGV
jgi:hypothetical protein